MNSMPRWDMAGQDSENNLLGKRERIDWTAGTKRRRLAVRARCVLLPLSKDQSA